MTTRETYFNSSLDEMYLLGAVLQHNELLDQHKITRELFYEESHRQIFDAIMEIRGRGSVADMPSVAQACPSKTVQIASLTNYLVGDVKGLVQRLRDCLQARGVASMVREVAEMQGELRPPSEVIETATSQLFSVSESRDVSYRPLMQVAVDAIKEIKLRRDVKTNYSGVESGLAALDDMTDGFQKGDYIILGARPSVGKTALALTLAMNASLKGAKVGFMSLEMKDTALLKRILSAQSNVSMGAIRAGIITPRAMSDLINAAVVMQKMAIFFGDVPNMSIGDLVAESRILKSREKIDLLIIDYIGLISVPQSETPRWETFSMVSQRLKGLARQLDIPVIALSQLRREADGKRPGLADLRESGSIEQDADLIMFMHREDKSNDQNQGVELIVAKQRNGPTGEIKLMFDKTRMKFSIPEAAHDDAVGHRQYKD